MTPSLCIAVSCLLCLSSVAAPPPSRTDAIRTARESREVRIVRPPIDHGPDITGSFIRDVGSYGSPNGISAFSVGVFACNIGDEPVVYNPDTNHHPVIAMSIYRFLDDRFEQLGFSWVYHTFLAASASGCGECVQPETGLFALGVQCSALEPPSITGSQGNLGPRSQINPHTGYFRYPHYAPSPIETILDRRIQINNDDLDPELNTDARYFAEAHFIAPDDARAGNGDNNVSFREATILTEGDANCRVPFCVNTIGQTHREQPAVRAWAQSDPSAVVTEIRLPIEGLFILAAAATETNAGLWHYEYALYNMNSDRSARAFAVPAPPSVTLENVGFHDVDYHSGEPIDGTDWTIDTDDRAITWSTDPFAANPNANALRWGTLYNFRFDANAPPVPAEVTVTLFKPGNPPAVYATSIAPAP